MTKQSKTHLAPPSYIPPILLPWDIIDFGAGYPPFENGEEDAVEDEDDGGDGTEEGA